MRSKKNVQESSGFFKVAVIGTGRMAHAMMEAVSKSKAIVVSAVASRELERAKELAQRHQIENVYGSYDELIHDDGYDLIYVSTINPTHYEIARKCLEARKAVMVEKPICLQREQVLDLVNLSRQTNTFLAEAMPLRYSSNMHLVQKLLQEGAIGKIRLIVSNLGIHCWDTERIREKDLGGGALFDLGVYGITLSDMLLPQGKESIIALRNEENNVDSQIIVTISKEDVQCVLINSTMVQTDGIVKIYGDAGKIIVNKAYSAERVFKFLGFRNFKLYRSKKNRYLAELDACQNAIEKGQIEPDEYNHEDLLRVYEIVDKVICCCNVSTL